MYYSGPIEDPFRKRINDSARKGIEFKPLRDKVITSKLQENELANPEVAIFGWTKAEIIFVELHLTSTAYQLLIKEYPAAQYFAGRTGSPPYAFRPAGSFWAYIKTSRSNYFRNG